MCTVEFDVVWFIGKSASRARLHPLTYEAIAGVRTIVASAQPELRSFLQNVLDESVLRPVFGCHASILEALRQTWVETNGVPYRSGA